jgi:hypothetical protein
VAKFNSSTDQRRNQDLPEEIVKRRSALWTPEEVQWLTENYPQVGKVESARHLGRSVSSVRWKASDLRLKFDRTSEFFKDFQRRAASSKVGKKRPEQAKVLLRLHKEGKLKKNTEQRKAISKRVRLWHATHEHPRGSLGMKHTQETLAKVSEAAIRTWNSLTPEQIRERQIKAAETRSASGLIHRPRGKWKQGWRTVGGKTCFFRSRWEANYARYLDALKEIGQISDWQHEPHSFVFYTSESGSVSYWPDFLVLLPSGMTEYHEVKGWMDDRSKASIANMKAEYPEEVLIIIDSKAYRRIAKAVAGDTEDWEYSVRRQY